MPAQRLLILVPVLLFSLSTWCLAQKADVSLTVGGTFVSDSRVNFVSICPGPACPSVTGTVSSGHHVYIAGTPALQLLGLKVVSLYLEVPIASIPSHNLQFSGITALLGNTSSPFGSISSFFVTPAFRLKVLPSSPISPFVSIGGGLARYSLNNGSNNRGALEYGGGLDFKTGFPLLGLRAEVRDFVSGDPNFGNGLVGPFAPNSVPQSGLHRHNILAGGGVVLRF